MNRSARTGGSSFFHLPLNQGLSLYNAGRFEEALRLFREAARPPENDPQARCWVGHCLLSLGRTTEAAREFSRTVRSRPRFIPARLGLAAVLRAQDRLEASRRAYKAALRFSPKNPAVRRSLAEIDLALGRRLLAGGRTKAAAIVLSEGYLLAPKDLKIVEELERARKKPEEKRHLGTEQKKQPRNGEYFRKAAERNASHLRWDRIVRLSNKSKARQPGQPEIPLHLAGLLYYHGQSRRAQTILDGLAKTDLTPITPPHARFKAFVQTGRLREAFDLGEKILDRPEIADLDAFFYPWATEQFKHVKESHIIQLETLAREGRHPAWVRFYLGYLRGGKEGVREYRRASSFSKKRYGWMQFRAGWAHLHEKDFPEAVRRLRASLAFRPRQWRAHGFMAEALSCLGRGDAALRELDRALKIAPIPERGAVLAWRGEIGLWLGRYREALRDLDEAHGLGALWSYCWRAGCLIKLGRKAEALKDLELAVRKYPMDREAFVWLGEVNRLMGRTRKAVRVLSRPDLGPWSLVNRALAYSKLGNGRGLRRDFSALPEEMRDLFLKRAGISSPEPLTDELRVKALEAGLEAAKGYRRAEAFTNAVWIRTFPSPGRGRPFRR